MEKISMSNEDYLEALVMLSGPEKKPVRPVDVANKLKVTKTSITRAVNTLKEKGLVEQPFYGDITLTDAGYEYGKAVYKRHRYLTCFLEKVIGLASDIAEDEACKMEHSISDESFDKWVAYIDGLGIMEED